MAEIGRRRAVSFCAPSLVKQLPKTYLEQTTLQVADGQLPTNKLKPLARTSFSFSGSQKSNLYSLLNPQDIGSTNDREAFASSGPYCGNLIEASDQPSPLSSHASFKVAVCVSPPSSLVLNVTFTNDHSTPTVVTDPSSLGLALRETTKSTNHSDRDSYSPSPKKIFAPVACSSPNASLLESAVVREYLARVTAENPFSGLKENDNFQQSDEQKLTVKKFHTASIFLHSPFTRPDLYWPLQFPYVASMKMPVQNATWIEQFKAHNLTPPGSKSTSEAECFYHDGDGDCRLPVRRRLISDNSATVSVCPSVSDEYLLDSLTSKVQTEQVRHRFKELEKKSDSTYLRLSSSISSTCAPFKIVDPIFGHRSGDSALLHNLANSCDKTVRPRLLPPPPPLSTSTCLSVPSSPQPRRTKSTQAASPLACSLPHPESPSEDSSKSTAERRRQASAGGNPLGRHEAVARRIRRQEINLMTPVSF